MIVPSIYTSISYFFTDVKNKKDAEKIYNELEKSIKENKQGIDRLQLDFNHIQDPEKMLRMVEDLSDTILKIKVEERYEPRSST